MVNKNVLSCLLKDGKEVNAVMLVGRLFHARATVTRIDRSPMVLTLYYYGSVNIINVITNIITKENRTDKLQ